MTTVYVTPYPDVNAILQVLQGEVRRILAGHFVGMYLDGSLASGDFDQDSDIDFVVATDEDVSGELFLALQAMHDRIATLDTCWAIQLEGSYVSLPTLRRHDPAHALPVHPNIERGRGERLKMVEHGDWWAIHRSILWERGVTLAGPDPRTLVDPVPPDDLRRAVRGILHEWTARLLGDPAQLSSRGYQSYIVLSMCRILYPLEHGAVVSKPVAARWARAKLDGLWAPLIERAWVGRHNPGLPPDPDDVNETLDLIRYTVEWGKRFSVRD